MSGGVRGRSSSRASAASAPFYHANPDCAILGACPRIGQRSPNGTTTVQCLRLAPGNICRTNVRELGGGHAPASSAWRARSTVTVRRRGADREKSALSSASNRLRRAELPAFDDAIRAGCAQMSCADRYWRWMCIGMSGQGSISLRTSMRQANRGCCPRTRGLRTVRQPTMCVILQELCQVTDQARRRMNAHRRACAVAPRDVKRVDTFHTLTRQRTGHRGPARQKRSSR